MSYSENIIEEIRELFVQGFEDDSGNRTYPTIDELAKKFNIPAITLYRKSKSNGWKNQKNLFTQNLQIEIDQAKQKIIAKEAKEFDSNSLKIAKALQSEIVGLLQQSNKRRKQGIEAPYFSPSALNSLGMALHTCQRVGRLALGESTENTNVTNKQSTVKEAFSIIDEICRSRREGESNLH
tara:strand:+ start:673 stop:1215 length:543 start_codon:yes stop_codon:yes gene_type:complete